MLAIEVLAEKLSLMYQLKKSQPVTIQPVSDCQNFADCVASVTVKKPADWHVLFQCSLIFQRLLRYYQESSKNHSEQPGSYKLYKKDAISSEQSEKQHLRILPQSIT